MNTLLRVIVVIFSLFLTFFQSSYAQERILPPEPPEERYYKATVVKILKDENKEVAGYTNYVQTAQLEII